MARITGGPLRNPLPSVLGSAVEEAKKSGRIPTAPPPPTVTGPSPAQVAAQQQAAAAAAAAAARAEAEAKARAAANNAARQGALTDLERLNAEITASRAKKATNTAALNALEKLVGSGEGSHSAVRDNALAALDQALKTKLAQLTASFETSLGDFRASLRDNEKSEADSSFMNFANRAREKQDLITQALSQGAGESDVLRTQLQALRNWAANQADVNRSFFDTRSSINTGITDLNTSVKTGMTNEELSANAARGARWDDFYEAMGNTYSDMANFDQNNYLLDAEIGATERLKGTASGLLDWLDAGNDASDYKPATPASREAAAPPEFSSPYAKLAAEMAGSTWKDPGISQQTRDWQGGAQSTGTLNTSQLWNAQDNIGADGTKKPKRPEGASLRRW